MSLYKIDLFDIYLFYVYIIFKMLSLNDDSLYNISGFLPKAPFNILRTAHFGLKFFQWQFPKRLILRGIEEYLQFDSFRTKNDISQLVELRINLYTQRAPSGNNMFGPGIAIVIPPTVKDLYIYDNYGFPIVFNDGIEKLTLNGFYQRHLHLPDTITELTLDEFFHGEITHFPQYLQHINFLGWACYDDDFAFHILDPNQHNIIPSAPILPDSVVSINVGRVLPVIFRDWPSSLQELSFEICERDDASQHILPNINHIYYFDIDEYDY